VTLGALPGQHHYPRMDAVLVAPLSCLAASFLQLPLPNGYDEAGLFSNVEGFLMLQDGFERFRHWPRLVWEWRKLSVRFQAHARHTRALFEAVREVSGKPVIVDTSKSPPRTFVLAVTPDIDLYLIHLVRDGSMVATSHKRCWHKDLQAGVTRNVKSRSVWETAARWISVNLGTEWVRLLLSPDKSVRLRYEVYATDPKGAPHEIGQIVDLDITEVASTV
jgi:hypothetical protein